MSPLIAYESKRFSAATLDVIDAANAILAEYEAAGFDLTLRQLYYQFVARGLIPNVDREYDKLGRIVNDGRLAGMIDWDHIVDRTRHLRSQPFWHDPSSIIRSAAASYRIDKWADQGVRLEVWIEKDALLGVIEGVCVELAIPFFSCRGYTSQSEMWGASQRLMNYIEDGKDVRILHLGDHDPSGIDMTRDIENRLRLFLASDHYRLGLDSGQGWFDGMDEQESAEAALDWVEERFRVDRLALNWEQIEEYKPPPNPAKVTDSRAKGYIAEYGSQSWELDALEPTVLANLIRDAAVDYRVQSRWDEAVEREEKERERLANVSSRWREISAFLDGGEGA
jgi:hypothetical protein